MRLVTIFALTIFVSSSPSLAQTSVDPSVSTGAAVPATWDGVTKDALFLDPAATKFRDATDVRERFGALDDTQRQQVRQDCQTILGSGSDAGIAADPADPTKDQTSEQPGGGPDMITSMNGLCTVIGSL